MRNTFHPNDIFQTDGLVAHKLENGSLFVSITNGEQVYVPGRIVEGLGVAEGDGLRCYCVPNPPEHGFNAKWKAIRCMITHRLIEATPKAVSSATAIAYVPPVATVTTPVMVEAVINPSASTPSPAPVVKLDGPELEAVIDAIIDRAEVVSAKEIYTEICKANPAMWKDAKLQTRITNTLTAMSGRGDIACAKLYAQGGQQAATAVYFARTVELIIAHMKGDIK